MSDARAIIATLRDGRMPSDGDLRWFAAGLADGGVSDAQAGAFAMAVLLRGLGEAGRVALTKAMRDSGRVLSWRMEAPVVDKHSTGGVGDAISLLLAPALAECGVYVPMISGRGLGHTGGTLDKLEAIPGLRTEWSEDGFRDIVANVGCAIVAATSDIAPADKRLYAVRDVTATVESLDLITASILSKKLAAGLEALVLDVKVGSGAFMASLPEAKALAEALVSTAKGAGCPTRALITDMDQPLGRTAGNALEIGEVIATLTGEEVNSRFIDLSAALGGELLALAGQVGSVEDGEGKIRDTFGSGRAAARFAGMVAAQGGPPDILEHWRAILPRARLQRDVFPVEGGVVTGIDTRAVGEVVVHLGGGRLRGDDVIDPSVGLSAIAPLGAEVGPGQPLARVHARDEGAADRAASALRSAYRLGEKAAFTPLIQGRIG